MILKILVYILLLVRVFQFIAPVVFIILGSWYCFIFSIVGYFIIDIFSPTAAKLVICSGIAAVTNCKFLFLLTWLMITAGISAAVVIPTYYHIPENCRIFGAIYLAICVFFSDFSLLELTKQKRLST